MAAVTSPGLNRLEIIEEAMRFARQGNNAPLAEKLNRLYQDILAAGSVRQERLEPESKPECAFHDACGEINGLLFLYCDRCAYGHSA